EARRIVRAAEHEYETAMAQEHSIAATLDSATKEALELARRSLKYDALKTDLEASKRLAESVLTRQKQTDVARGAAESNVHLIDAAAVPRTPIKPRPIQDSALTLALALGCALVAAFVRDYLDGSVRQPSDVRRLGLPLLGVIAEGRRVAD